MTRAVDYWRKVHMSVDVETCSAMERLIKECQS